MSGGSIRTAALSRVAGSPGAPSIKSQLSILIDNCKSSFLQFIYEAGIDGDLNHSESVARGVPIAYQYMAIQLADDLADGDLDYLDNRFRDGVILLMRLHQLNVAAITEIDIPYKNVDRAAGLFAEVGDGQREELVNREWTAENFLRIGRSLNGAQHAAYLELLWAGTRLENCSNSVGYDIGLLVHLYTDILTGDERYFSISAEEKKSILNAAHSAISRLRRYRLSSLERIIKGVQSVF